MMDNDAFAGTGQDRDYSGGVSLTVGGNRSNGPSNIFGDALDGLDQISGAEQWYARKTTSRFQRVFQIGMNLFTPENKSASLPIREDRPYANLVYLASSRYAPTQNGRHFYQSSLVVGLLGTNVGEFLQDTVHEVTGSEKPKGFENQISDGIELTGRYAVSRHTLLISATHLELNLIASASLGYLTEGSAGLSIRIGHIPKPGWPSISDYTHFGSQPLPIARPGARINRTGERYWSIGFGTRFRAYNAFLQGQVRDSHVRYSSSQLNRLLFDAWIGYTTEMGEYRLNYSVRYQSAEISHGPSARDLIWASISLARNPQ